MKKKKLIKKSRITKLTDLYFPFLRIKKLFIIQKKDDQRAQPENKIYDLSMNYSKNKIHKKRKDQCR